MKAKAKASRGQKLAKYAIFDENSLFIQLLTFSFQSKSNVNLASTFVGDGTKDFMEQQQHGCSDSTPRAGSDRLQKSGKSLLSALQLMSICQKNIQKYGSGHFDPF